MEKSLIDPPDSTESFVMNEKSYLTEEEDLKSRDESPSVQNQNFDVTEDANSDMKEDEDVSMKEKLWDINEAKFGEEDCIKTPSSVNDFLDKDGLMMQVEGLDKFEHSVFSKSSQEKSTLQANNEDCESEIAENIDKMNDMIEKDDIHIIKCGNKSFYKCPTCGYQCGHRGNLLRHMQTHSNLKLFKCPNCSYEGRRKGALKVHMLTHSDKKLFKCPDCEYEGKHKSALKVHILTHSDLREFKCSLCSYEGRRRDALKVHMLVHSNTKLFKCQECSYECNQKELLRKHKLAHEIVNAQRKIQDEERERERKLRAFEAAKATEKGNDGVTELRKVRNRGKVGKTEVQKVINIGGKYGTLEARKVINIGKDGTAEAKKVKKKGRYSDVLRSTQKGKNNGKNQNRKIELDISGILKISSECTITQVK